MPPVSVTIITLNEAAHIEACLASVAWADEVLVVDSGSTDGTPDLARARGARVIVRDWPGYAEQKNFAAGAATHDWILCVDADERVTPALASEIRTTLARDPREAGFRIPRVTWYLGRWIRTTDWYPDYQLRLYHRARATWPPRVVHESVAASGEVGRLRADLQHFAYRDLEPPLRHDGALHDARGRGHASARPARWDSSISRSIPAPRSCATTSCGVDSWTAAAGLIISAMNAYYVFLKFAKLWAADSSRAPQATHIDVVITSLHIDTAQTWRGGQNQVLQLVTGLESLGHPTWLVAHRAANSSAARRKASASSVSLREASSTCRRPGN